MIFILAIALILIAIINIWTLRRRRERLQIFNNVTLKNPSLSSLLESQLTQQQQSFWHRISNDLKVIIRSDYNILLMGQSKTTLFIYIFAGTVAGIILNQQYINYDSYIVVPVSAVITIFMLIFIKKKKLKKEFYETFPEALTIITGVVSAGSALTTSFKTCGNNIEGSIGKIMKEIDNRLEIGESAEEVLISSYRKLPFPEYYFFILTVMVNLNSGGELREVLHRLKKMLTDNRALAKTRDGKTAELRMTIKILGCMPFGFIFLLKLISQTNYEYLIYTTVGHYILYYVIGSVAIGIFIIKGMINKII